MRPARPGRCLYVYADDNPTSLTDPSGHQATLEFRLLLGASALVSAYLLWAIGQQIIAILQQTPVNLGADLKLLDPTQNSTQGSRLRGFTTRCGIPNGDVYLVSPGPTTYGVCKSR